MNFSLYIAKRYLFSKNSNNAINIITFIAVFAVMVGTLSLFVVLSVFSGLKDLGEESLNAITPSLEISPKKGKSFFFNDTIQNIIEENKDIAYYSKVIEEKSFLKNGEKEIIANFKAVDTNFSKLTNIRNSIYTGSWFDKRFENSAVIGIGISNELSISAYEFGANLKMFVPKPGKGTVTSVSKAFNEINTSVTGVFAANNEDLDFNYIFIPLKSGQELLGYKPNQISSIELSVPNASDINSVANYLKDKIGNTFEVKTRNELNADYYRLINSERFITYLIFCLILIIALFNVVGVIIMMIIDKKDNQKTLYNIGASIKDIKRVFILQGFLLSVLGLFIGLGLGIIFVLLQQHFGIIMITSTLPYPMTLTLTNVSVVFFTILALGYIASLIASSRISKQLID
ncbi:ABC transporter permease [Aureivirga sp. CE67]|uniref:ABC transporter permease n=1 Tax=Aureivirga sp. CE67 TaxID=1788983 RepID=UPI0018C94C36|nr:FtsX-like permease family protein [Aureivirga sp. CE67]